MSRIRAKSPGRKSRTHKVEIEETHLVESMKGARHSRPLELKTVRLVKPSQKRWSVNAEYDNPVIGTGKLHVSSKSEKSRSVIPSENSLIRSAAKTMKKGILPVRFDDGGDFCPYFNVTTTRGGLGQRIEAGDFLSQVALDGSIYVGTTLFSMNLNPTAWGGPKLAARLSLFSKFKINALRVQFLPSDSTDSSGSIVGVYLPDPADPLGVTISSDTIPQDIDAFLRQIYAYQTNRTQVFRPQNFDFYPRGDDADLFIDESTGNSDPRLTSAGLFALIAETQPAGSTATLVVYYDIELFEPVSTPDGVAFGVAGLQYASLGIPGQTPALPFGTVTAGQQVFSASNMWAVQANFDPTAIYFTPFPVPGVSVNLQFVILGTGITALGISSGNSNNILQGYTYAITTTRAVWTGYIQNANQQDGPTSTNNGTGLSGYGVRILPTCTATTITSAYMFMNLIPTGIFTLPVLTDKPQFHEVSTAIGPVSVPNQVPAMFLPRGMRRRLITDHEIRRCYQLYARKLQQQQEGSTPKALPHYSATVTSATAPDLSSPALCIPSVDPVNAACQNEGISSTAFKASDDFVALCALERLSGDLSEQQMRLLSIQIQSAVARRKA